MARNTTLSDAENAGVAGPTVNRLSVDDLREALRSGMDDFRGKPSHAIFLTLIYPIVCFILIQAAAGRELLPLVFPLVAGFALLGPLAAVGLYELSRRREAGQEARWSHAFAVFKSPSILGIAALALVLAGIFLAWLYAAQFIYEATMGQPPETVEAFIVALFTTGEGWRLILIGNGAGFLFALFTLSITAVSFPMLLDRQVDAISAVMTSIRLMLRNPKVMLIWGAWIAGSLVLGFLPFAVGLAVVLPIFGHATWHLYRRAVTWQDHGAGRAVNSPEAFFLPD